MTDVLLLADQLRRRVPGGIGTYVRGLVQGLASLDRSGEPVPPVALYASRPPRRPDPLDAMGRPVRASVLSGPLLTMAWDVGALDVPGGFAVVHAASLATPPARRAALAVTVHDLAWRHAPGAFPPRGRRWHEAALRRALERADAFVVPSAPVADDLLAAGAPSSAVHVVPHGSDHLPPPDEAGAAKLLERLGVEGEYLLSVGTLEPRKNLLRLLDAYELALSAMSVRWPLVVVGPVGWGRAAAEQETRSGVVLAGPVTDGVLAALYRRARLLAYVPLLEGFGLPPLEAMACGTPVVASPMPSSTGAVFEVQPTDVAAIADAVCRVATDDELRAALVDAGRVRAATRTWAANARAHVRLWEALV